MAAAQYMYRPATNAGMPASRLPSPRGLPGGKPDFREGSSLEERDKTGRRVATYRVGRLLGRGGFAKCYEVTDEAGAVWAVKVIDKASLQKNKMYAKMQTEISIHRRMKHKNIIDFRRTFSDDWNVYIILEKCDNQTLMEVSKTRRRFSVAETQWIMQQSVSALEYMHRNNVIHRDLKLGNMMMDRDMNVKIGDFGLAAELHFDGERKRTICGTPNYIAPEILQNAAGGHSYEVDVWSLGVILYTLIVGEPPFQTADVKTTYSRIKQCRYSFPAHIEIPDSARFLIQRMLQSDPAKRPSLAAVRDDAFLRIPTPPTSAPLSLFSDSQRRARERAQLAAGAAPAAPAVPRMPLQPQSDNYNNLPTQAKDPRYAAPAPQQQLAPKTARGERSPQRASAGEVPLTARPRSSSLPVSNRPSQPTRSSSAAAGNWADPQRNVNPTANASSPPRVSHPRLEEDDRRHLADARDQLHQSLMAPATSAPASSAQATVAPPAVWVTDYADFSGKYGLSYRLSTGHTGVHYNDSTKMVWEPISNKAEYYARVKETVNGVVHATDELTPFAMDTAPESLNKKVTLIKYFKSYLSRSRGRRDGVEVVACSPFAAPASALLTDPHMTSDMIYVKRWMITQQAVIFRLSNKTIQVCFFDKTEVILMSEQRTVAFTDPSGRRRTMPLSAVSSQSEDVAQRLKYTKDILCKLISNKEI
uniref:Serine/threonine-protein kinase PLK n=1 Tax=Neobodo designis TaxID=312471 RepID=A0A7S1QEX9_NEODS|mmetsp:Transcript_4181/g.13312  ORF Transcript_4181/g.13312 Transcript_4181/m.13312 type:complete len:702 (+) Transcript_4181:105-2210(+)|eukprot:CAMPEP_0174853806 /NCGR_PEP_ID=MMETSP1114-20130205/29575_1 /TAXON_ID=312471 /ORGANISM="Neobodo designis, Strain CCAP 1951/1" /LENGTH=701 /DNA_ID=CAMNT_0016088473 /DNA_START=110 /DNA_END=2215 /DNA_ORIENTATION=+